MPTKSTVQREFAPTSFGTYGATGTVTWLPVKQIDRTRTWSNSTFRTARQRAARLLSHGFLPTQAYADNLQHVVNSKQITVSGKMSWAPNATFLWRFIPQVDRIGVSLTEPALLFQRDRALDHLQGQMSGVGVSVPMTIMEAGKTADMIGEAAGKIFRSYRHLRHGNFLAAAKSLGLDKTPKRVSRRKSVSENWMEYRYGWRLVVYDIQSYMKQIYDMLTTKPVVFRKTAHKTASWTNRYTDKDQNRLLPLPEGSFYYDRTRIDYWTYEVDVGYVYALESVALSTGQELGLLNLASVAWDAIPASFMADWAANVSSVLEGLTAFQGKTFLDGWQCLAIHSRRTEYWTNFRPGPYVTSLDPCAFYAGPVEERRFSRSILQAFQPARLRLDFSASFQNGLDGLALIKQVFGSGSKGS